MRFIFVLMSSEHFYGEEELKYLQAIKANKQLGVEFCDLTTCNQKSCKCKYAVAMDCSINDSRLV